MSTVYSCRREHSIVGIVDAPATLGLAPVLQNAILRYDTCKVANAIESLGIRLKNEGFTRPGLQCASGRAKRALGFAVTARVKCSDPPIRGSASYYDLGEWWQIIAGAPTPRIAVIEDVDTTPGLGAVLSDIHAHVLTSLNCRGAVTNGAVRDVDALATMDFPAFAGFVGLSHAYVHMVASSCPVEIFGLPVQAGDLVYVDVHGMIQIPHAVTGDVVRILDERAARETRLIDMCRSGQPLETIRKAARKL